MFWVGLTVSVLLAADIYVQTIINTSNELYTK